MTLDHDAPVLKSSPMKTKAAICCLASTLLSGSLAAAEPAELAEAEAAIAAFAGTLKAELTTAMQAGGPLNAIEVCSERAPAIADSVSLEKGMNLSRVSLRNRNPENAPNEWQTTVLQEFEARLAAGQTPPELSWHQTEETNGTQEFRFMKAIPTGSLCLTCHGEAIAPLVAAKISELYPADKATGFREGDLRGAFVVTKALQP
jgi:hypothetical protein